MRLKEFAYCPAYDNKIGSLALLSPEKWSFGTQSDNAILKNYIEYTFQKLEQENKIQVTDSYALFNTGLYDQYYEPIFALFTENRNPDRQKWYLSGFYIPYQLNLMMGIHDYPPRANYFQNPADLVFDTKCDIIPQYTHIFETPENYMRLPDSVRDSPMRKMLFKSAVENAKRMIDANYKTAVPQYYKGRIQLLIPICLSHPKIPDLALVVDKNEAGDQYLGHTCLDMNMAYNNARLIAKPESSWLVP